MRKHLHLYVLAFAVIGLLSPAARAQEAEDRSIYYEDDAWYDITEWFDGNDYNPTDEAIGRWDNERFRFTDELTSGDGDNDWNYRDYGHADATADADRWFYDYYDDGYSDWYDYDSDGVYDGYAWYHDSDDDGVYDGYTYYVDSDRDGKYDRLEQYPYDTREHPGYDRKQTAADQQNRTGSRAEQVAGEVQRVKTVGVRGTKRLIAELRTNDGKTVAVDLGSHTKTVAKDKRIEARGPRLKVGDKSLVVAMTAKVDGQDLKIQRDGRRYQGKVQDTREVTIRGQKYVLAKVNTASGKKMLVDLGRADNLAGAPNKGQQVAVDGVPVKVKDRVVLMARSLTIDGHTQQVNRQTAMASQKR